MYSRNRVAGGEDRYTNNIPPVYNGNRFSYARREYGSGTSVPEVRESDMPAPEPPGTEEPCETILPEAEETAPAQSCDPSTPSPSPGGLFSGISQEELLLIALLLLLSAEHERSMDIIVILLLLIGIH